MSTAPTFDRDTTSGDRQYAVSGDTAMVAGRALVIQRLIRRALTAPGSIPLHPTYGCGLLEFVEATVDDTLTALISGRIQAQFVLDPDVVSVDNVVVTQDQRTGVVLVTVWVTLSQNAGTLVVPISIH